MLEENPLVRLTDQADEICRACPNNLSGQCESAKKVRRYDREVLSRCGLTAGDVLPYRELAERVHILGNAVITGLCMYIQCPDQEGIRRMIQHTREISLANQPKFTKTFLEFSCF